MLNVMTMKIESSAVYMTMEQDKRIVGERLSPRNKWTGKMKGEPDTPGSPGKWP